MVIDRSSVLFWAVFLVIVLACVTAFWLSLVFFFSYSDFEHLIYSAWYTHDPIGSIPDSLLEVIILGTLPILTVLGLCGAAFRIERKMAPWESWGSLLLVLGMLALPWGGFHLFAAVKDYVGATEMAASSGVADPSNALLLIYGGYGLGVGVLWIVVGITLFLMGRKLLLDSS